MLDPKQGYWAKKLSEEQNYTPTQDSNTPKPYGIAFLIFSAIFFFLVCSILSSQ